MLPSSGSKVDFALTFRTLVGPVQSYMFVSSARPQVDVLIQPLFGSDYPPSSSPQSGLRSLSSLSSRGQLFGRGLFIPVRPLIPSVPSGLHSDPFSFNSVLMTLAKLLVGLGIVIYDLCSFNRKTPTSKNLEPTSTSDSTIVAGQPNSEVPNSLVKSPSSIEKEPPSSLWKIFQRDTLPPALFLGSALVARGEIGVSCLFHPTKTQ